MGGTGNAHGQNLITVYGAAEIGEDAAKFFATLREGDAMVRILQVTAGDTFALGVTEYVQNVHHEGNGGVAMQDAGVEEAEINYGPFVFS